MKIAYFASSTIPSRTANSVHVMYMCEAMAQLGHEVMLITPQNAAEELADVADVYEYYGVQKTFAIHKFSTIRKWGGSLRKWTLKRGYASAIRRFQPDLVYGRSYEGCAVAVAQNIPTCMELHGPFGKRKISKPRHELMMRSNALKQVVVISKALKKILLSRDGAPDAEKIIVAHDAAPPVVDHASVPDNWTSTNERLQVGYAGGLYPGRGVEVIIGAASRLPDMDFHMMGGSAEDVATWKKQSMPENLHFHGHVPAAEVAMYRNGCDILLAPYQQKVAVAGGGDTSAYMSPLKIFEYMASGKLMLVSDMPVLREVLDESFCMLLPPADVDAWCEALEKGRDAAIREMYGRKALREFEEKYTWSVRAESVLASIT